VVYPKASTDPEATGVPPTPRFPTIEERVLAYWAKDGTFLASVEARDGGTDGSNEFVFYDGPPFANGLPHYGHLLTGYVKDLVPRYRRCAASGSSAASAGTPTACPPSSRR
jgi:isoleucyl-tRNA synthetase